MRAPGRFVSLGGVLLLALFSGLSAAAPATAAPEWHIDALANTTVEPGEVLTYHVYIQNVGDAPAPPTVGGDADNCLPGSPPPSDPARCITITAELPDGLTPLAGETLGGLGCQVSSATITCRWSGSNESEQITYLGNQAVRVVRLTAKVAPGAAGILTSHFQVSGGGAAAPATTLNPTPIGAGDPPFGIESFDSALTAAPDGELSSTAGAHPYAQSTDITFNTATNPLPKAGELYPRESSRDIVVDLPQASSVTPPCPLAARSPS